MNTVKILGSLCLVVSVCLGSCIEPYIPENIGKIEPKVVVDGLITDQSEEQEIVLSYTSSPDITKFIPMSGCSVKVSDSDNHTFNFTESYQNPGHYSGTIGLEYLTPGHQFKLNFVTSSGLTYESTYQEMLPCPAVDSIYY